MTAPTTPRPAALRSSSRRFARSLSIGTCVFAIVTCVALLVERPSARELRVSTPPAAVMVAPSGRDPSVPQAVSDPNLLAEALPATF